MRDLPELYTRIAMLCILPLMGIIAYLSVLFNNPIGIALVACCIVLGVFLMYKRLKIEQHDEVVN